MHTFIGVWTTRITKPIRTVFAHSEIKDLLIILVLAAIGFAMLTKHPGLLAIFIGILLLSAPFIVSEHREKQRKWQLLSAAYLTPLALLTTSRSLATGGQVGFVPAYQKPLVIPEAGIFLNANEDTLRLVSYDDKNDALLPVQMIAQIDFDAGNFLGTHGPGSAKSKRRLLLRRYMPTIFLGVRCGTDHELVVYPLCFHPDMAADARDLYERLCAKLADMTERVYCPLSAEEFERALPGSFDAQSLPRSVLLRFWPDYKGGHLTEWLSR